MSDTQIEVLKALEGRTLSRKDIFATIGMNSASRSFKRYMEPLLADGFIEMTVPDKPNSRLQKYRLTDSGKAFISDNGK
ncbi:MAG: Fic family protein [Desulfitobacterium sp.]